MAANAEQITIWSLFLDADPVVKGVMLMLAIASVWCWAIIIDKWLRFGRLKRDGQELPRR